MICTTCQTDAPTGLRCDCGDLHCPACYGGHVCPTEAPPLWPHQERALAEVKGLIGDDFTYPDPICITSPTGGGKTRLATELASWVVEHGRRVVIYSFRKLVTAQTKRVYESAGLDVGMMAAEHKTAFLRDVQIASIQTVYNRVFKQESWKLHEADLVIIDEPHQHKGEMTKKVMAAHTEMGVPIVGTTATPLGLADMGYKKLVVAGTNSKLRACGALVLCATFAPNEPDLTEMKRQANGEFVEEEVVKRIMLPGMKTGVPRIFGSVLEEWRFYNPQQKPTLLFAPDVASSRWFADWLNKQGVSAAHIDGKTPMEEREQIAAGSEDGTIKVVCNRFVLREGVDWPWLAHGILATAFGAVGTYIQAGGRLLRAYPGLDKVIIQDHGGNYHRPGFGSLNDDRAWSLGDTNNSLHKASKERREKGDPADPEPLRCPRCSALNRPGKAFSDAGCWNCGFEYKRSVRLVIQTDGTLKRQVGAVTKKKRQVSEEESVARGLLYMAANSQHITVAALAKIHRDRTGRPFPDGVVKIRGGPVYLPDQDSEDWKCKVRDVFPGAVKKRSV